MTPNHTKEVKMPYRPKKLTKKKSRKNFTRGSKTSRKNTTTSSRTVRRGGNRM